MLTRWLIIFALVFSFGVNSQEEDSSELKKAKEISQLLVKADEIKRSNHQEFKEIITDITVHELEGENLFYYRYLKAYEAGYSGNLASGISAFKELIKEVNISKELQFKSHVMLVTVYGIAREFPEAIAHIQKVVTQIPDINEPKLRIDAISALAVFYNLLGQSELALEYFETLFSEPLSKKQKCLTELGKIKALYEVGKLNNDLNYTEQVIQSCMIAEEKMLWLYASLYKSRVLRNLGDESEARIILEENLEEVEKTQYPILVSEYLVDLSDIYFRNNNLVKSRKFGEEVAELFSGERTVHTLVKAYKTLYQIAKSEGNLLKAIEYLEKYAEADKAHLDEIKARTLAFEQAKHDLADKEYRLETMAHEQHVRELNDDLAMVTIRQDRYFMALLIIIIVSLVAFIVRTRIHHMKMMALTEFDDLTKVANRKHFSETANEMITMLHTANQPASIILFDLDNFKQINDNYGHPAGDIVLAEVAKACLQHVRSGDLIGRLGGEEFAILLPNCSEDDAAKQAEYCRKAIEGIDTLRSGYKFNVTASFGIVDTNHTKASFKYMISAADQAMYKAKKSGRNRIACYREEDHSHKPFPYLHTPVSKSTSGDIDNSGLATEK